MASSKLSGNLKIGIGVGIIALIVLVVLYLTKDPPQGIREVIDQQLAAEKTIDSNRKSQLKVQLAVNDFQMKNDGRLPKTLSELVPTYFDTIPVNSNTGKPWEYRVVNGMPRVGTPETVVAKNTSTSKQTSVSSSAEEMTQDEEQALIASIEDSEAKAAFVYDPTGKRDPFMPYSAAPEIEDDENKTELEKFAIGQLRLTAILDGFEEPRALVETSTGKGYTIMKGTKIGTNSGEVIEIVGDKVLILETTIDFTGEKKTKTIELQLPTRDN